MRIKGTDTPARADAGRTITESIHRSQELAAGEEIVLKAVQMEMASTAAREGTVRTVGQEEAASTQAQEETVRTAVRKRERG